MIMTARGPNTRLYAPRIRNESVIPLCVPAYGRSPTIKRSSSLTPRIPTRNPFDGGSCVYGAPRMFFQFFGFQYRGSGGKSVRSRPWESILSDPLRYEIKYLIFHSHLFAVCPLTFFRHVFFTMEIFVSPASQFANFRARVLFRSLLQLVHLLHARGKTEVYYC